MYFLNNYLKNNIKELKKVTEIVNIFLKTTFGIIWQ